MYRLALTCLLAIGCRATSADSAAVNRCRALGDGATRGGDVALFVDSTVSGQQVTAGQVPPCGHSESVAGLFVGAVDARRSLGEVLEPGPIAIHVSPRLPRQAPPLGIIEYHRASASIWVDGDAADRIDRSMWLHELAHAVMGADRPDDPVAGRLVDAVEEAAADFLAAAVAGSPVLGTGSGERRLDVESPLPVRWEALALPGHRFDTHRAGQRLAARLWQSGHTVPRAADVARCLGDARFEAPGAVAAVAAIIAGCPAGRRDDIAGVLRSWLPPTLAPADNP